MSIQSIKKAKNLKGKRVMVRVDYNVPVKRGKVLDDTRLLASLSTIKYLIEKKAVIILVTHLGRPKGEIVSSLKVDPVMDRLSKILKKDIKKLKTSNWKFSDKKKLEVVRQIDMMRPGQIAIMENIRFSPDEKKDTGTLSQELANLADIFVLDGFAVAHRPAASVAGVTKYIKGYAGLLLEKEIKGLEKVIKKPKKPFVVVLGGAKTETKIPVMKNLLPRADYLLVAGGIVNNYLQAARYGVGRSLIDEDFKKDAHKYCKKRKVITPIDVVVGKSDGSKYRVVKVEKKPHTICKKGEDIFDIGPGTIQLYAKYIKQAQTLVWNGAMGYFEQQPYDVGTLSIARLVASRSKGKAYGVIGGGETLQTMDMVGMTEYIDLVSTGGGAMLEFLAGKELPGIKVLSK